MTKEERSKIKVDIICTLPTGFLVDELAEILIEIAKEIREYHGENDDDEEDDEEIGAFSL